MNSEHVDEGIQGGQPDSERDADREPASAGDRRQFWPPRGPRHVCWGAPCPGPPLAYSRWPLRACTPGPSCSDCRDNGTQRSSNRQGCGDRAGGRAWACSPTPAPQARREGRGPTRRPCCPGQHSLHWASADSGPSRGRGRLTQLEHKPGKREPFPLSLFWGREGRGQDEKHTLGEACAPGLARLWTHQHEVLATMTGLAPLPTEPSPQSPSVSIR